MPWDPSVLHIRWNNTMHWNIPNPNPNPTFGGYGWFLCPTQSLFSVIRPLLAITSSTPLLSLFICSAPPASPHLARPLPARHTIFGITPLCQAASQWHQLSPLPFQHPLLSAAQSWSIYRPSNWSFSQTTQAKGRRGCRDVSQLAVQTRLLPFSLQ